MEGQKKAYPVCMLCRVMEVSRSGVYDYVQRGSRGDESGDAVELIAQGKTIHAETGQSYGSRRMAKQLQDNGYQVTRYRARSLMCKADVAVKRKKRFKVTTESRHNYPVAPNLLARQFDVEAPNRVWGADITYLWTMQGWLYLAVVIDLYSRKVVGWSMSRWLRAELVHDALVMALWRRRPNSRLMHHSDRGSQYACEEYRKLLKRYGVVCSMSRKGDCWDNAVVERFFRSLKSERTDHRLYRTREEARRDVIDYIEMFFNSRRKHSSLGYISPNEFEEFTMVA